MSDTPIAMTFSEYGPPDVLQPTAAPLREPGPGQVRVAVRAAGVQPFDCVVRRGDLAAWMPLSLPAVLGNELAGIVDAAGPGVTHLAVGDQVLGFEQLACYAESVVLDADHLVGKPAAMPWVEAGGLSASGQTADTALDVLQVGPGDVLLVHAAAGGVGSFAVQLAVARGATVIGTASERNHEYLTELGALALTYGPGLEQRVRELAPQGVTAALDGIGGDALEVSTRLVDDRSRIGTVTDRAGAARLGVALVSTQRHADRLARLVAQYESGLLRVPVSATFALRDVAQAHRHVETGHARGKIVLTVA